MIRGFFTGRNILIALAILASVFVGFRTFFSYSQTPAYETVEVKKTTVTQNVTASGEIRSEDEVELKFPVSGKLVNLAVKKNSSVKKGGYIGSLDKYELQKKMDKALRDYSKERWDFEQDKEVTYKNVFTDTAKRILEKNQFDLDKAVADVEIADFSKNNADLYSPIDGAVTQLHTFEGTSVLASTTPIVTIADPDEMVFIAKIGEADITNVVSGQEAIVTLDAFEGREFRGKVTEIDYAATTSTNGGGKTYQVKIVLDDLSKIKLDMSGDVEIVTISHQDALSLPRVAVQEKNGQKYVEVVEGKQIRKREVATGIRGIGGVIEVLSGVTEGEKVIIPTQSQ